MASQQKELVWLITGASSGLGYQLVIEALSRHEKVIATSRARSIAKADELKIRGAEVLELDVTAPLETLREVAKKAMAIYGRVDVLVNNAGYGQLGTIEEVTPEETYAQFNTNFFGALNVTRAFLPYMRENKTGTVVWLGSMYGLIGNAYIGIYAATKWALRGVSLSLHGEVSPIGLRSICVNFGYFRTAGIEPGHLATKLSTIPDYKELADSVNGSIQAYNWKQPGDPVKGVKIIIDVIRGEGEAEGKPFPPELVLGPDCYNTAKEESSKNSRLLDEWKDVSCSTDFDD